MRAREGAVRAALAVVIVGALGYEFIRTAHLLDMTPLAHLADYLSYFTTLSNALAALILVLGALVAWRTGSDPEWYRRLFVVAVAYTMTTCAVYNAFLRPVSTAPDSWGNEVLHLGAPVSLALLWLASRRTGMLPWRSIRGVLGLPLAWLGYTMARGAVTGWYPYDFLNPHQIGGVVAVTGYVCLASSIILAAALGAIAVTRVRASRVVDVQRDGREQLVDTRGALGAEHLTTARRTQQQCGRGPDAVGLRRLRVRGNITLARRHDGNQPLNLGHGPPRRRAWRAERRGVEHDIHARVNVRRAAPVPVRPSSRSVCPAGRASAGSRRAPRASVASAEPSGYLPRPS